MQWYYSKSTNGFYNDGVHSSFPEDVVTITQETYDILFENQLAGQIITSDADGNPINAPRPPQTPNYILLAKNALLKNDVVASRCTRIGIPYPAEWIAYDSLLRNIVKTGIGPLPQQPAYPSGT